VHALIERPVEEAVLPDPLNEYPYDGIEVHRLVPTLRGLSTPSYIAMVGRYIRRLEKADRFDVIHAHSEAAGFLLYSKPRAPVVVTVHGLYSELLKAIRTEFKYDEGLEATGKMRILLGAKLYSMVEALSCRKSQHVIAITPMERELIIKRYGVRSDKITVVPNGVDLQELENSVEDPECMAGFERPVVLFVGRLSPVKGIPQLVRAWLLLKEQGRRGSLVIVGKSSWLSNMLLELNGNHRNDIHVFQNLPRRRLLSFYRHSDIFVSPSLYEAIGYTMLDALALGKPVLLSSRLGFERILQDCVCYADPLDSEQFAAKLETLMDSEDLRSALAKKAKKLAESSFPLDVMVERVIDVYREVVHSYP